jgi:SAM-dependent methyltransferase
LAKKELQIEAVKAGFDYRFSTVGLRIEAKGYEPVQVYFPLATMLRDTKILPEQLQALMQPEYEWTEPLSQDIDPARVRLLESVDWRGKTVLDIGGYDGFAAEIAHKGGAKLAICLDNHQYEHYGWQDIKREGVEYVQGDVMHLEGKYDEPLFPGAWNKWDVLINYNVLYHVKNPWAFLDKCRSIVKEDGEMLLCTLFRYHTGPWMYVYEPRECNPTDETVYFGPSLLALERLLKHTGWDAERYALTHDRVLYRCKPTAGWTRKHEDT